MKNTIQTASYRALFMTAALISTVAMTACVTGGPGSAPSSTKSADAALLPGPTSAMPAVYDGAAPRTTPLPEPGPAEPAEGADIEGAGDAPDSDENI
ncbi:hypothetical protein [Robiginitomaculum antarcticum]|uniref:hypothetical protein n=1 Tax=Robiginitomaculum antarcticum TaxID=437507 RepID=UPI00039F2FA1|nr:hypothetical protein [Robiginitomaculum antarcticum]